MVAHCTCPEGTGRSVSRCVVGDALLPQFCWQCMCVYEGRGGKTEEPCAYYYELGLYMYVGFLQGHALFIVLASSVLPTLARTRDLGALKPGSRTTDCYN